MLKLRNALILLSSVLFAGCESVPQADYVEGFDFAQMRTFVWAPHDEHTMEDPILDNELTHQRIEDAVTAVLSGKGMTLVGEDADLLVTFHTPTKQRFRAVGYSGGLGYPNYDAYWRHHIHYATPEVESFEEAALVIDIVDKKTDRLLWRGWDTMRLTKANFSEEGVRQRVSQILSAFPP